MSIPANRVPVAERLWAKVVLGPVSEVRPDLGPCWMWHNGRERVYPHLAVDGRWIVAHRLAYELTRGPIPEGLQLDHLCRVPGCVRPLHHEVVTPRENYLRGVSGPAVNAAKTHCIHGHPFDAQNTKWVRGGRRRDCRTCGREALRRFRAAKRAAA